VESKATQCPLYLDVEGCKDAHDAVIEHLREVVDAQKDLAKARTIYRGNTITQKLQHIVDLTENGKPTIQHLRTFLADKPMRSAASR
jgi:hypothetical protein